MNWSIFAQRTTWYGLLYVSGIALVSFLLILLPVMHQNGISSLVLAIVLGIIIGNVWHCPPSWGNGIQFASKYILRTAIVLYGFRVSFQQMASVGFSAFLIDICVVFSTLFVGFWVGKKIFKLDRDLSILISAGAAICGAAAVLAVEDILKSEPYKTAAAVGTVILFGTFSMFLYPFLQKSGLLNLTNHQFGIFSGASIHEVAQVLVAGTNINNEVGEIGVIVKMIRVLLLVPVLMILAWIFSSKDNNKKTKIHIPWFAVGFLLVIGFNSLHLLSQPTVILINQLDIFLLTMAMAAIGIETKYRKLKHVGIAPLYLSCVLFIWLFVIALSLVSVF